MLSFFLCTMALKNQVGLHLHGLGIVTSKVNSSIMDDEALAKKQVLNKIGPGLDRISIQLGLAPPTPPSLPSILPAPAWELFLVGNQCDNTQS
jgi:hypothetical protein